MKKNIVNSFKNALATAGKNYMAVMRLASM